MITTCMYGGCSDWYKGYPDCGSDAQSPINLAANTHTVVKARKTIYVPFLVLRLDTRSSLLLTMVLAAST